ncbi:hypothetical protein DPMN_069405 [Dreissena polymorpha]|uniref:Uncharacterized protein n=1 Tax=Dreissena polymorpha TaxID=45954 RepID=A0A9D4BUW9_DREPO|nr:hypothetical protein DPMN_069405 [Dreissena polymorpha]
MQDHIINDVYTKLLADQQLNTELVISTAGESLNIDELDNIARQNAVRFEENGGVSYNNYDEVKL